jgi:pimeloyl-ACP methyl ester carboxylesterase
MAHGNVFQGTGYGVAILLPAIYCRSCFWSQVLEGLRGLFRRVIVFDEAICEREIDQSYVADYSRPLSEMIKMYPDDRFAVFGNSFGSLIAIETGRTTNAGNLTVVFSGCPGLGDGKDLSFNVRTPRSATPANARRVLRNLFVFPDRFPPEEIDRTLQLIRGSKTSRRIIKALREVSTYNVKQRLLESRCRNLAIWGTEDKITNMISAKDFIVNHTDCSFFEIGQAGHCPMLDQPDRFMELVAGAFAR